MEKDLESHFSLTSSRPDWLRVKLPTSKNYLALQALVSQHQLHTICTSGRCPNIGECWQTGTATFMILGDICTRNCLYCSVKTGRPKGYDSQEPKRVAKAIFLMGVKHAVITSVNRDELKDCGAEIWYQTVVEIKALNPKITIETLIPDVKGIWWALERMISAGQEIVSYNLETVERLYRTLCPQKNYVRSLEQLNRIKAYGKRSKSGIMLGLGETDQEVYQAMDDLRRSGVDVLTLGQYLQPTAKQHQVVNFVHPDKFAHFKEEGLKRGFDYVESGPLVRSSYHSERHL